MFQLSYPNAHYALEKAAETKQRAQAATDERSRRFWETLQAKWLGLAGCGSFAGQLNDNASAPKSSD